MSAFERILERAAAGDFGGAEDEAQRAFALLQRADETERRAGLLELQSAIAHLGAARDEALAELRRVRDLRGRLKASRPRERTGVALDWSA